MAKKQLDWDRNYGRNLSMAPTTKCFSQDGNWYDSTGNFVEEINPGAPKPAAGSKRNQKPAAKDSTVERAEAILGDLGPSPQQHAARENAKAASAENLSDDA